MIYALGGSVFAITCMYALEGNVSLTMRLAWAALATLNVLVFWGLR